VKSFRSVALGLGWRTIHNIFHNPSLLLPGIMFPLLNFAAFAGGLSRLRHIPGFDFPAGYTGFQFVFILLQSAAFQGVFMGFSIARDFEYGFARRLLIAAPRRSGLVAGYALASLARWSVTAVVVTAVALAVGMRVHANGADLFGLYGLALILNIAGLMWATGVAMRWRTIQAGPIMQTPVFLILFFSPVYVPLDLLRGWIHAVAVLNPLTRLLEAGRSLLAGTPREVAIAFATALSLSLFFSLWALLGLRRAEAAGGS
jgi:ABC-2 type transport system permease protein